jgi:hypothetical protein
MEENCALLVDTLNTIELTAYLHVNLILLHTRSLCVVICWVLIIQDKQPSFVDILAYYKNDTYNHILHIKGLH